MTTLSVSHLGTKAAGRAEGRFARAVRATVSFFEILAAAARVSRAVEARRAPAGDDLRTLGINGKLPSVW